MSKILCYNEIQIGGLEARETTSELQTNDENKTLLLLCHTDIMWRICSLIINKYKFVRH